MGTVAGNGGSCCTCDQQAASGCACSGVVPCSLSCQSKSGSAGLCGLGEYADETTGLPAPSDPPKFYRTQTVSGSAGTCFTDGACGPNGGGGGSTFRGTYKYSKTDCSEVNDQHYDQLEGQSGAGNCGTDGIVLSTGALAKTPFGAPYSSVTHTMKEQDLADLYHCTVPIRDSIGWGAFAAELTDEDTEDDAEARAAALVTDWGPCTNCLSSCSAFRTDRTGTGLSYFGFRKVQTKCTWTAVVGSTYDVTIHFARRLLGSTGPFLDLGLMAETSVTPSSTSGATGWIDVPNEAGWETVAATCVVQLA